MSKVDSESSLLDPFQLLPSAANHRILSYLPLSVAWGHIPQVSKLWLATARSTPMKELQVDLQSSSSATSFARWMQQHGQSLVQASIKGLPLFSLESKAALCSALAATCSNLQSLSLPLPLSQAHEDAVFSALSQLMPRLKSLSITYTPGPDTTTLCCTAATRRTSATLDDYISPATTALASASQLQQLIVSGAGLADCRFLQKLTELTHLELPLASSGLDIALLQLTLLRHIDLTSHRSPAGTEPSATAARQGLSHQLCNSLSFCCLLTTLKLCGFKPADTSSTLLAPLSQLQRLGEVDLAGCLLEAQQLVPLSACTRLSKLGLASNNLGCDYRSSDSSTTDNPMLLLLSSLPHLVDLDVSGCNMTSLQPIFCCCSSLTALHAGAHRFRYHPNAITSTDLQGISGMQRLQMLDLSCNRLDSSCFRYLAALTMLTSLSLAENDLGYVTSSCSSDLRLYLQTATTTSSSSSDNVVDSDNKDEVNSCSCSYCRNHSSGLQYLSGLQQLKILDLSSCCLRYIFPLAHLTGLVSLKLGYSGFWQFKYNRLEPNSFTAIGCLTGLQYLDLHYCRGQYTRFPSQASSLANLSKLTHLDISGCWDACWQVMQPSRWPASAYDTTSDDRADACSCAAVLSEHNGARAAEHALSRQFPVLQELLMLLQDFAAVPKVAACCSNLVKLHMSDGGQQMQESVRSLAGLVCLTSLTHLSISSMENLHCLDQVAVLTGLKHLKLFSAAALPHQQFDIWELTALTSLTCLDLNHGLCGEYEEFSHGNGPDASCLLEHLKDSLPGTWIKP